MNPAKAMYESWRNVARKSLEGDILPTWEKLPILHQKAWEGIHVGVDLGAGESVQVEAVIILPEVSEPVAPKPLKPSKPKKPVKKK